MAEIGDAAQEIFNRIIHPEEDINLDDEKSLHSRLSFLFDEVDEFHGKGLITDDEARMLYRIICLWIFGRENDLKYLRE